MTHEELESLVNCLSYIDLMDIYNEFSDNSLTYNDAEFFNSAFQNPWDAIVAICNGQYNLEDEFILMMEDNIISSDDMFTLIDIDDIKDYIKNNPNNEVVKEILEEYGIN